MTVKELKEILKDCSDTDLVVMSKDGEGNGYSPLSDVSKQMYEAESTWSGAIYERELTDESKKQGYTTEDIRTKEDGAIECVVLWPTN